MRHNGNFGGVEDTEEEETNWQDSYSDLMTDLLAIFVVLFAFAMMSQAISNAQKVESDNIIQIGEGTLGGILDGDDGILDGEDSIIEHDEEVSEDSYKQLQELDEIEGVELYKTDANVIQMRLAGSILFDSGKAELYDGTEKVLEKVAEILSAKADNIENVKIEGHTDNVPISSGAYKSNWELSAMRAIEVTRFLMEHSSLDANQFSASGFGEHQPIANNDTEEGRAINRRVVISIELKDTK